MVIGNFPVASIGEPELVKVMIDKSLIDYFHIFYYVTVEQGVLKTKIWADESYDVMVAKDSPMVWYFAEPTTLAAEYEELFPVADMTAQINMAVYRIDHEGTFRRA